jgi:transposase
MILYGQQNSIQERIMLGNKDTREEIFHYFRMRDLVPDGHILKLIDKHVDFSFVRGKVKHLYSETGRPSVDPELMVKMLLVGYLFGIKSERRLCEEVGMHMGYRWFVGLNMGDTVPDHSTFSKNRHGRFAQSGIWEEIFDEIVRRCIEAGLVRGEHVTADGTLVNADAAVSGMQPVVVEMKPGEYLAKLDGESPEMKTDDTDGGRDGEFRNKGKEISNETHRSPADPDARIARKGNNSDTKLRYQVGYVMDNASRVILDASVSGLCGRGAEMALALAGLEKIKWKFKLRPRTVGADKGYATGQFIRDAYEAGITPHVPVWDTRREHDAGIYTIERFEWDEANNRFICPEGKALKYHGKNHKQIIYRAGMKDCGPCPVKDQCTKDRSRSVSFHAHQEFIDRARDEMKTRGYRLSQRNRKKIEELFGEAKELMGFRRMKLRRLKFVIEQALLTATAQNIKRLVKHLEKHAPKPAQQAKVSLKNPKNVFVALVFRLSLEMLEYISKPWGYILLFRNSVGQT